MSDLRSGRQPAQPHSRPRSARSSSRSGSQPRRRPAGFTDMTEASPIPAGYPDQPAPRPRPDRQPGQPPVRRRRKNSRRKRRARIYRMVRTVLMILLALAVGYFIGFQAGKAQAAAPTGDPVPSGQQTASPQSSDPLSTDPPPEGPKDVTAPKLMGVNRLSIFLGSTVSYRSGILLSDDLDPAPTLTVDSSRVNLSATGTYPVVYTATDSAGNATSVETTITVVAAPDTYVDEAVINETADKLLKKILKDGMTPEQQVNAIYDYIENHSYYVAKFDKSDYKQAAYIMMTEYRGDCFGYYAVSRLLFERLGLPNLTVTRMKNDVRTTGHWWNMVSLDNGETWYHFDATPHLTYPTRTCLITDADLEAFNELMPNYYYFDHSSYPQTPAA